MKHYFTISERKKLYAEVWSEPLISLSKKYGISNVALKKRCIKLQIPTPPPGYWTIFRSGGQTEHPPLPKYKGEYVIKDASINPFFQNIERQTTKWSEESKFDQLIKEATDWELAQKIRDYVSAVEMKVMVMRLPATEKAKIMKRIKWAKAKADWVDPAIAREDKYLGERNYRRLFFDDDPYYKW